MALSFVIGLTLYQHNRTSIKDTENNKKVNDANAYSILYKKMLSPVLPYGIRGAIWYQGEANVGNYEEYNELFPAMIEDWRERWGYNFPFYYVQIAPFNYEAGKLSYELRDVQRKSLITLPFTIWQYKKCKINIITMCCLQFYNIKSAKKLIITVLFAMLQSQV